MKKIVIAIMLMSTVLSASATLITTNFSAQTDVDIRSAFPDMGYNRNVMLIKNRTPTDDNCKAYIRFQLPADFGTASNVTFTMKRAIGTLANTYNVYVLNDGVAHEADWSGADGATGTTWNNAPGNITTSATNFINATWVGSFQTTSTAQGGVAGDSWSISTAALVDALNADSNGYVTLMISRVNITSAVDQWASLENGTYAGPSLTMNYVAISSISYLLTVNSGTGGGGTHTNGEQVAISATGLSGKTFVAWTGDTAYLADSNAASTTVTMPAQAVSLTATYVDTTYALTVTSGTGDGSYTNGQQVAIVADAPDSGYAFDRWTGDIAYVASVTASNTTVTMPAQAISLTAMYTDNPAALRTTNFLAQTDVDIRSASLADIGYNRTALIVRNSGEPTTTITNSKAYIRFKLPPDFGTARNVTFTIRRAAVAAYNMLYNVYVLNDGIANETNWPDADNSTGTTWNNAPGNVTTSATAFVNATLVGTFTTINTNNGGVVGDSWSMSTVGLIDALNADSNKYVTLMISRPGAGSSSFDQFASLSHATYAGPSMTLDYVAIPINYLLTVNSGNGGGSYTNGQQVAISAAAVGGKTFASWTGDTAYLADSNAASTTVTMPAQAVSLTATYVDTTYALTVTSGTGGGSYTNGHVQSIAANAPAPGQAFSQWTGDTMYLADSNAASTTVTMPAQAVSLTATYKDAAPQSTTNGTPYSWMDQYGLTNYVADDILDQDNDGLLTWQEYVAGTVPTNSASCFKAAQATRNVITWIAQSNRIYSVYWSTDLVKGFAILQDNITLPQSSYTNATPDGRVNHYQIKVRVE